MRISNSFCHALIAFSVITMLAGCSAVSSQMGPPQLPKTASGSVLARILQKGSIKDIFARRLGVEFGYHATGPGFFNPDAKGKPLIFASDTGNSDVNIYLQRGNHKMVGEITGPAFPTSLATDIAGNVYILDLDNSDVPVYAPPYTKPPKVTLDDSGYEGSDIAVSNVGVVAIANACAAQKSQGCSGPGNVTFYAKNATKPCSTIVDSTKFAYVFFDAFDDKGTLYVVGFTGGSSPVLGRIKGGCKAKKIAVLKTTNPLSSVEGGIKIDRMDRIAIIDGVNGSNTQIMDTYARPKKGLLGNPISSITLTGVGSALTFAFISSGANFWVVDNPSALDEFSYPGGVMETSISGQGPAGVAVTPPLIP